MKRWIALMGMVTVSACTPQPRTVYLNVFIGDRKPSADFVCPITIDVPGISEVYTTQTPFLTQANVERVYWTVDERGQRALGMEFTEAGAALMRDATSTNITRLLVLELDGDVVSAPFIAGTISKGATWMVNTDNHNRIDAFAVSMGAAPYAKSTHAAVQRRIEAQQRQ
jgi:hypothetical protein